MLGPLEQTLRKEGSFSMTSMRCTRVVANFSFDALVVRWVKGSGLRFYNEGGFLMDETSPKGPRTQIIGF